MIVTRTVDSKPLPFDVIAVSEALDTAYYIRPEEMQGLQTNLNSSYFSPSGTNWLPEVMNSRLSAFLAGNPGAGKSYLAKQLISLFPPEYEVVLFTALEEDDGNFSNLGRQLYKIRMEPEVLKNISLSVIRQRCPYPILLFDDIDKIRDKNVEKLTLAILEDALANGRGHKKHDGQGDVHVIVTSHALNDYRKTKYTLENSDYVALFPGSTTYRQLQTMFSKLGLSDELCKEMYEGSKRGHFRYIIIHKVAPMFIIAGSEIILI
ncbi:MAG: AAA family ATPase [Paludibacteraceae bacterium]|nr:AAA family ATPase [Paludibacteraceae bacterium]